MSTDSGRLHALDNLRALMMWLGIVIHSVMTYTLRESPIPWRDEHTTLLADLLLALIHAFRMPVFFVLAGFFVTMLLRSRGPRGMARHRAMRLGLPFAVFWLPIFIASGLAALAFVHLTLRGTWGIDPTLIENLPQKPDLPPVPRTPNTMHMWFLWMLLWMSLATALLARFVPPSVWVSPARWLRRIAAAWWGPLVLALPVMVSDMGYPQGFLFPSGAWIPLPAEWVHHGIFFVVGLALYEVRDEIFAVLQRRRLTYALLGVVPFLGAGAAINAREPAAFAYVYALCGWLWTFAAIGMALKWMPTRSKVLGYLADSSYWVYLVHFPFTIIFGALLYGFDWPGVVKMTLVIAATTVVCLATYHAFVRFTWVSVLLNGKRHPRPQGPAALTPA
jgi:glucan biosynthesis protein C